MESLWALGFWATFSVRHCQGGEIWCATEPGEAFQTQQILARLESPPAFPMVLPPNGFMPAAPYRLEANADALLDRTHRHSGCHVHRLLTGRDRRSHSSENTSAVNYSFRGGACVLMLNI